MKALFLHLSDIHFKKISDPLLQRAKFIASAVKSRCEEVNTLFIVVSGDVAFSGTKDQYNLADGFFCELRDNLKINNSLKINIVFAPGNHDCDFSKETQTRDILISHIRSNPQELKVDDHTVNNCIEIQSEFWDFAGRYHEKKNLVVDNPLYKCLKFNIEGKFVVFNIFNMSWMSELHEKPSELLFPFDNISPEFGDLNVSVIHHPPNWLEPTNARGFKGFLKEKSSIVFSGHEHISDQSLIDDLNGNSVLYVEGNVLQDSSSQDESGFNILKLDLTNGDQSIEKFCWDVGSEKYLPYDKSSNNVLSILLEHKYQQNNDFRDTLGDPGASFKHPNKSALKLDDIFVYPDLKKLDSEEEAAKFKTKKINSNSILDISKGVFCILFGDEKSGKTSLLHRYYNDFYGRNLLPVLIHGCDIKNKNNTSFEKVIEKAIKAQYDFKNIEEFRQADNNQKVILIDDFDQSRLNSEARLEMLSSLSDLYPNIIITADKVSRFDEMLAKDGSDTLGRVEHYEIKEFGFLLRQKLIEQWICLGRHDDIETDELILKSDNLQKITETVIGKNFVPSYPIFLLTILQSGEAGNTNLIEVGQYGHYYEYLILQSYENVRVRKKDIDFYHSFLSELAIYLFKNERTDIDQLELAEFAQFYSNEYDATVNLEAVISKLTNGSFLAYQGDYYQFKYSYVFYYFVARYLANNIGDTEVQVIVKDLCSSMHRRDYANVLIFLTHHSKSPYVINQILESSNSIFSGESYLKLGKDIEKINQLVTDVPTLVMENKDVRENRLNKNKMKDDYAESNSCNDEEQEIDCATIPGKINLSFKVIEILGQILKNHHSSMKGSVKLELAERSYMLCLKGLDVFLKELMENLDFIITEVDNQLKKKKKNFNLADARGMSNRLVFDICGMLAFSFIQKLSLSIGTEDLKPTFKKLLDRYSSDNSVKLIDLAIKLDFPKGIPFDDIKRIQKGSETNILVENMLKQMVINYTYMFDTSFSDKQKIASILGLSVEGQTIPKLLSKKKNKKEGDVIN